MMAREWRYTGCGLRGQGVSRGEPDEAEDAQHHPDRHALHGNPGERELRGIHAAGPAHTRASTSRMVMIVTEISSSTRETRADNLIPEW